MRYELSDDEWTAIKPMLPNKPRGVPRVNNRRFSMIVIDAAIHLFVGVGLAAEAVDLRPAGDARQHVMPPRAKRDLPLVFAIVRQRARADRTTAIWSRCPP